MRLRRFGAAASTRLRLVVLHNLDALQGATIAVRHNWLDGKTAVASVDRNC
jgi:hypothetical protein